MFPSYIRIASIALLAGFSGQAAWAGASPAQTPVNQRAEAKLAKALQGRVAGKPVDCIQLRSIRSSQIFDGTAIVYDVGSTLYVNRPTSGAPMLDDDDILVTNTHSSQLCSIDIVRLVDRGSRMSNGSVGLGQFVPYTRARP